MSNIFQAIGPNYVDRFEPDEYFCFIDFEPTASPPGSLEKIEVLRKRAQLGQPLWHVLDNTNYEGFRGHKDQPGVKRHRNKVERRSARPANIRTVSIKDVLGAME